MTAIIGYADGKTVWIGGDSGAVNGGWQRMTMRERKVWRSGEMLIGGSGRWAVIQLLQANFEPPICPPDEDSTRYLYGTFIPALKAFLKDNDTPMTSDESSTGLVVGFRGVVYHIDSVFDMNALDPQIIGDGSGGDLAKGAFRAFLLRDEAPETALLKALTVAAEFNLTVAPPFYVERLEP